jgi:hypothetical protein
MHVKERTGESPASAFTDDLPQWAAHDIASAVQAGIVNGYEDRTFRANLLISRAEIASMIMRATDKKFRKPNTPKHFSDANDIPAWASAAVNELSGQGLIKGRGELLFLQ